jgi:polyphosphate glucokinase
MIRFGIDIGGTGVKGAPVDVDTGQLVGDRFRVPTPQPSTPEAVLKAVEAVVAHHGWTGPVGATFPGVVIRGVIQTAANVDKKWRGIDGQAFFAERLGQPVTLLNDADAAGVAEMRFGVGQGRGGVVVMITLGTGIGCAVFHDGVLLPNTELGHIEIDGHDAERLASGKAREKDKLTWPEYAKRVQKYLRRLDNLLWPDLYIIGGGVSKDSDKFLAEVRVRAEIEVAKLLNNAGIVGAALSSETPTSD